MPDFEERVRRTAPQPSSAPPLDVDALMRRARRRTLAARAGAAAGAVAVLVGAVALGTIASAPRTGQVDDVELVPAGAPATSPDPRVEPVPPDPSPAPDGLSEEQVPSAQPTQGTRPEGEILAEPTFGRSVEAPPGGPAAPACGAGGGPDGLATITVGPDVPAPRCLQVLPAQRLRVVNGSTAAGDPAAGGQRVSASLGGYAFRLDPGEEVVLPLPVSSYLQPGVHRIDSDYGPARAEVWVLRAPSASVGQQAVIDALLAFARAPSDRTFQGLPLGRTVALGDGTGRLTPRAAAELRDPAAWPVPAHGWRSPLGLLGGSADALVFTVGQRPHCDGALPPPPLQEEGLTRLGIQTPPWRGCHGWFAVDLFVDDDGTGAIRAVVTHVGPQ